MDTWTVEARLGTGAQGEVYRARGPDGRVVAVKRLIHRDPAAEDRLRQSLELLARCDHPAVVRPLGEGDVDGERALVMEYAPGAALDQILPASPPPVGTWLAIAAEVSEVLHWVHRGSGLVHRDLHAGNVVLTPTGHVRLLDLGLARPDTGSRHTASGHQLGALSALAPEGFLRAKPSPALDVFAVGALVLEGLGRPLYGRRTARHIAQIVASPARFDQLVHGVGQGLPPVALRALAHRPGDRPTAWQLAWGLRRAARDRGGPTPHGWARVALARATPGAHGPGEWTGRRLRVRWTPAPPTREDTVRMPALTQTARIARRLFSADRE